MDSNYNADLIISLLFLIAGLCCIATFVYGAFFSKVKVPKESPSDKLFTPVNDVSDLEAVEKDVEKELDFNDAKFWNGSKPVPGQFVFEPVDLAYKVSTKKSRKTAGNSKLGPKKKPKKRKPKK